MLGIAQAWCESQAPCLLLLLDPCILLCYPYYDPRHVANAHIRIHSRTPIHTYSACHPVLLGPQCSALYGCTYLPLLPYTYSELSCTSCYAPLSCLSLAPNCSESLLTCSYLFLYLPKFAHAWIIAHTQTNPQHARKLK